MKKPLLTIAIPTCYGGESLVKTVRSIKKNVKGITHEILIVADRTPLTTHVKEQLKRLNVSLIWNTIEGSQFKKLKQLIAMSKGEIFVFTQDDITFDKNTFSEIRNAFATDSKLTMVGSRILPLSPITKVESGLTTMVRLVDQITYFWDHGKNYLSASGRCLAFKTSFLKKYRIPEQVVNGDMFLYLENKRLKGTFDQLQKSIVYIRCPQKVADQIGPSSRYQFSENELQNYFRFMIHNEYKIPLAVLTKAFLKESLVHPVNMLFYLGIFSYTRVKKQSRKIVSNPVWKVDTSTKATHA